MPTTFNIRQIKKSCFTRFCILAFFFSSHLLQAEVLQISPGKHITEKRWPAQWIAAADAPASEYGIYHYRKKFSLSEKPDSFVIHISADNRYRLFVNEQPVHIGPERGDLQHWRFDSLDIASYLKPGGNLIAVQVWNFGVEAPVAQISKQTALVIQGDGEREFTVNTDASWLTTANRAYSPIKDVGSRLQTYIVVGPGDRVNADLYPWDWEKQNFDDSNWKSANELRTAGPRGTGTDGKWLLIPRMIPLMESKPIQFQRIRLTKNINLPEYFLEGNSPFTIPANTECSLLIDQNELTTAYPELEVSGGRGSEIKLTYAESLYEGSLKDMSDVKGNRDEVDGKHIRGFEDIFLPDGGDNRSFRPLRWRTYRYVEVKIKTADNPLQINSLKAEFTGYPFVEHAQFNSDDPDLSRIWNIAWRTLRTGSHEVYTDSPYYEQLSYVGDTRIEALTSLYVSGDDRLMRKSIQSFDDSRNANGLTSSRYPDSRHQLIPPYSLVWISMVHDYWQLRDDPEFVESFLPGIHEVLRYFSEHSDPETGSYTGRKWWNYVDWKVEWGKDPVTGLGGVPPRNANGTSAILDLQYVYTLQQARDLFRAFGQDAEALHYDELAIRIRSNIIETCWDVDRMLIADTSEMKNFSQHANTYFILTAENGQDDLKGLAVRMLEEKDLAQASLYFSYYTHLALIKAGLGDSYLNQLELWQKLLPLGLTTLPETPSPDSRSDSHAWGAHPILGMLSYVCGIKPNEPGFRSVRIEPHLGTLPEVYGRIPHSAGFIHTRYSKSENGDLEAQVILPEGLGGIFIWGETAVPLIPGENTISIQAAE